MRKNEIDKTTKYGKTLYQLLFLVIIAVNVM